MPASTPSHTRPRLSRQQTPIDTSEVPYVPQPDSLILPDGPVGEDAAELLTEFVHPGHGYERSERTLVEDIDLFEENEPDIKRLPWWKRPSAWWCLCIMPFAAIATSATIAPRIEIYTMLACSVHRPDIFKQACPGFQSFGRPFLYSTGLYATDAGGPNVCASDPVVQAAVAKLSAVITTCTGILSCLTAGWWGSLSDRYGRTRVLAISAVGWAVSNINVIFVTRFFHLLPGGYWFLLLGPIVEGSLGGLAGSSAAIHAYQADTTTEETRSRIFSLNLGLLFTGMALGPTLGSLLIRFTGVTISTYYLAASINICYLFLMCFIVPESLTHKQMRHARKKYDEEIIQPVPISVHAGRSLIIARTAFILSKIFAFLNPLRVFFPTMEEHRGNALKKQRRDWSLALTAASYGFTVSVMGSYTYKFQYAASIFGWTSETLGYWLSSIGAIRAAFLTMLLPFLIKFLKPKPVIMELPARVIRTPSEAELGPDETQPLLSNRTPSRVSAPPPAIRKELHSPAFDLGLARASLFIDVVSYTATAAAVTPSVFTVSSMLGAMGSGFSPAIQSVAFALYTNRGGKETGKLFGALSVVQALSSQIIGPSVYGLVYVKTVASCPKTIFFVSSAAVVISFMLLAFVRLPPLKGAAPFGAERDCSILSDTEEARLSGEGDGDVHPEDGAEERRGGALRAREATFSAPSEAEERGRTRTTKILGKL